jgi:hypothetical protein
MFVLGKMEKEIKLEGLEVCVWERKETFSKFQELTGLGFRFCLSISQKEA